MLEELPSLYVVITPLVPSLKVLIQSASSYLSFMMNPRVRKLFKELLYMGKEYPQESGGYAKFSRTLKSSFHRTPANTPEELESALAKGQYIIKELESLYFLKRYRHLKRTYG